MSDPSNAQQLLQLAQIPFSSEQFITPTQVLARDLRLDFGALQQAMEQAQSSPALIQVYADVLVMPEDFTLILQNGGLVLFARDWELAGSAQVVLDYRKSTIASVIIATVAPPLGLSCSAVLPDGTQQTLNLQEVQRGSGGVLFSLVGGQFRATPVDRTGCLGSALDPALARHWSTSFIFAQLLADRDALTASSIATWTLDWARAAPTPGLAELAWRSAGLLALLQGQLAAQNLGARFVPVIAPDSYAELAKPMAAQAVALQQNYQTIATAQAITAEHIAMAKSSLTSAQAQTDAVTALQQQAQSDYENANAAVTAAETNLRLQQAKVSAAQANFSQIGLEKYRLGEILKAVFNVISTAAELAISLGLMTVGDEAAAPTAAAAVEEEGVELATFVNGLPEEAAEVKAAAETIKKTGTTLKEQVEAGKKIYEFGKTLAENAMDVSGSAKLTDPTAGSPESDDSYRPQLSVGDAWSVWRMQMDDLLASAESKGIEFATDYRQSLDVLAICGQALVAAQTAAASSSQALVHAVLMQRLAAQQQAAAEDLVQQLQLGLQAEASFLQVLYQGVLDAKSSLATVLQNYRAAYFYWALSESSVTASLLDAPQAWNSVLTAGLNQLTGIAQDKVKALESLRPVPQALPDLRWSASDATVLNALKTNGCATIVVDDTAPQMALLQRVRIHQVRVWLEGVGGPGVTVQLKVQSSGIYRDQFQGQKYRFTMEPLRFGFHYQMKAAPPAGGESLADHPEIVTIQLDGKVADSLAAAYQDPTPLTEWTITLQSALDLGNLTGLTMQFSGSACAALTA